MGGNTSLNINCLYLKSRSNALNFQEIYKNQVSLLLEVLPVLNEFKCFALKGGTAINLFIHDMPRLSVDIDLTYLPIESRDVFLSNIETKLLKMKRLIADNL